MLTTRYRIRRRLRDGTLLMRFHGLHNAVNIKYVHNRQKIEKTQNSIEITENLEYSINHREKKVGRNNIFGINCDCVPILPQDIVPDWRRSL